MPHGASATAAAASRSPPRPAHRRVSSRSGFGRRFQQSRQLKRERGEASSPPSPFARRRGGPCCDGGRGGPCPLPGPSRELPAPEGPVLRAAAAAASAVPVSTLTARRCAPPGALSRRCVARAISAAAWSVLPYSPLSAGGHRAGRPSNAGGSQHRALLGARMAARRTCVRSQQLPPYQRECMRAWICATAASRPRA